MSHFEREAECPSCGAPITFKLAGARAVVCQHCQFVVARTDGGLKATGRMADLLPLQTPFELGRTGRWNGETFEVEGRLQLDRVGTASAPWQEMLLGFPLKETQSWVAYAQGRWYATSQVAPDGPLPPQGSLTPGAPVELGQHGRWVVQEIGQRKVVSGEGCLDQGVTPGTVTGFADLSAPGNRFGTIDYGDGSAAPTLYLGQQFDPTVVRFDDGAPLDKPGVDVTAVECPNCGGNLPVVSQAAERIVCRYCGTASDMQQGSLALLGPAPKPPMQPAIPLGQEVTLRGLPMVVCGFVIRSCVVEGVVYPWREYLLYAGEQAGYRWLMEEDGNWSFVEPVETGEVIDKGSAVTFRGAHYTFSQSVTASVDFVVGEFYWKVEIGETVEATEWQGNGAKVSRERNPREVNMSVVTPLSAQDRAALGLGGAVPAMGAPSASSSSSSGGNFARNVMVGCLVLFGLFGCFIGGVTFLAVSSMKSFKDVVDGDIKLAKSEIDGVRQLMKDAGIKKPDDLRVYEKTATGCVSCSNGVAIHNGHVVLVNLESKKLKSMAGLADLPELERVQLRKNLLTSTEGLGDHPKLRKVDLSFNAIKEVGELGALPELTDLNLSNNRIKTLAGLHDLPKLNRLNLSTNPVESVAGMGNLGALQKLELTKSRLTDFKGIGPMPALQVIQATDGKLTGLAGLATMPKLREIDASRNLITSLEGVGPLPATKLNLTKNKLTSTKGIEQLSKLRELNLSSNRLTSLEGVAGLTALNKLDVQKNELTSLEAVGASPSLKEIDASGNKLTDLTGVEKPAQLITLRVANNQITSLEPKVGNARLAKLYADGNKIQDVKGKAPFDNLQVLSVGRNQLAALGGITLLGSLTALSAPKNQLTSLAGVKKLSRLKKLEVQNNKLTSIDEVNDMVLLKDINASHNKIAVFTAFMLSPPKHYNVSFNPGSAPRPKGGRYLPPPPPPVAVPYRSSGK